MLVAALASASGVQMDEDTTGPQIASGPFGKYDPPIEASFVGCLNESMLTTVIHEGNSLEDNMWTRAFLDRLGVRITYDWIARSDEECSQKWSVSVAAGDVPDMMEVQLIDLKRLHDAGALAPLQDAYDQYIWSRLKEENLDFASRKPLVPLLVLIVFSYMPMARIVSWVILAGVLIDILSPSRGFVNRMLSAAGFEPIFFLADPGWFRVMIIVSHVWKEFGFGTIIYLAAITTIDPGFYEAAVMDGARRFRQMAHHHSRHVWALGLPVDVPVWNVLILLNFFRRLPVEMEESAAMDGAGHWTILWKIYIPTSLAALATLVLFAAVTHWNAWFDGMIYMRSLEKYPLQTFLRSIVAVKDMTSLRSMTLQEARDYATISDRTLRSAQILVGALPILLLYPFLQRYFVKGIVIGSVKG